MSSHLAWAPGCKDDGKIKRHLSLCDQSVPLRLVHRMDDMHAQRGIPHLCPTWCVPASQIVGKSHKLSSRLLASPAASVYSCMYVLCAVQVGVHGLIIEFQDPVLRCKRSATFLPEVAKDQGWSQQECIEALIKKAGGCWHGVH